MIEIFERGGIMMYPLVLASIFALAIIIERFFSLRKKRIIIPDIINVVETFTSFKDMPEESTKVYPAFCIRLYMASRQNLSFARGLFLTVLTR